MICHRTAALALVLLISTDLQSQNLLPNPSFEAGDSQPTSWILQTGEGAWAHTGHEGQRSVSIYSRNGYWRTSSERPVEAGQAYVLRYWGQGSNSQPYGVYVELEGVGRRPMLPVEHWAQFSYAAVVPANVSAAHVRVGQYSISGASQFDEVEVKRAWPVNVRGGSYTLGAGESFQTNRYLCQTRLKDYRFSNYSRALHEHTAPIEGYYWAGYWQMNAGQFVTYRHELNGLNFTNATVKATLSQYSSGTLFVDYSADGLNWQVACQLTPSTTGALSASVQTNLPPGSLPAAEVYVRLRATGRMDVSSYEFQGEVPKQLPEAEGYTWFVEQEAPSPGGEPRAMSRTAIGHVLTLALFNTNGTPRDLTVDCTVAGPAGTRQSQQVVSVPALATNEVELPLPAAGAGENVARVKVLDQGTVVFDGSVRVEVAAIQDDAFGYQLPGPAGCSVWWCEAAYKVARDRAVPSLTTNAVQISAARNEYEPFQIVLRPDATLSNLTVTVGDFSATQSAATIASTNIEVCVVDYVPVTTPTDYAGVTGDHPDPLVPLTGPMDIAAGSNQPFWFTVFVPKDTPGGDYEATVTLQSDAQLLTVPVRLKVYDFALSDVTHTRSAYSVRVDPNWHKPSNTNEEHLIWDLYMQNFRRHRISPYAAHLYAPIDWTVSTGQFTHDFTRFDEAMTRYLDEFGFTAFNLMGVKSPTFPYQLEGHERFTPEYNQRLIRLFQPIMSHLREKGWADKAYCYWYDEPPPSHYPFVLEGMEAIQQAAPGLQRLLTVNADPPLHGSVDIWCPFSMTYDFLPALEHLRERQAAGDETWWYVGISPKAPSPNNFIDHPAINPRIRAWLAQRYGVIGDLYWDTTEYTGNDGIERNPWEDAMSITAGGIILGNGDGMLLYPPVKTPPSGPVISGPINSMRWELIREGMEDREYFWLLKTMITNATLRLGPQHPSVMEAHAAYQAALDLAPSPKWFNRDPQQLYAARNRIAQAIEQIDDGAPLIVKGPRSQTGWRGHSVTLRSEALGWPKPRYQWQADGLDIPGATNATVVLGNLGLRHVGGYRVIASNVFGVATSEVATLTIDPPSTELIAMGAAWRYHDQGQEPPPGWSLPGFDDSAWSEGPAQLGYGDGDEQTMLEFGPDPGSKHITTHFRHTFQLPDSPPPETCIAQILRDDGVVVYLNGTEIFRGNLPAGEITPSTTALLDITGEDESMVHGFAVPTNLLQTGANVLAVEVHQVLGSSDDLSFSLALEAGWYLPPSILLQPASLDRQYGESAFFSVTARGDAPLTYQWWFNEQPMAGQTQGSLTLTYPNVNNSGVYHVVVSNMAGAITSAPAFLTVVQPPNLALVQPGGLWRFFDQDQIPGTGWQLPGFDDSGWSAGSAQFGYGDGDEQTIVRSGTNPTNKHSATYFRRLFNVPHGFLQDDVVFGLLCDDGAVVYLNGLEVVRHNLPTGAVSHATLALGPVQGAAESAYLSFSIPANLFQAGTNLLAVEVHQHSPASEDLSFDAQITGYWQQPPQILEQPAGQVLHPGGDFTLSASVPDGESETYQWMLDGRPVPQATNSALSLENLAVTNAGLYHVVISNHHGAVTSAPADLVVLAPRMLWGRQIPDKSGYHLQYWANSAPSTLLVSSNLTDWNILSDMPAVPGLLSLVDLLDRSIPARFYRVQFPAEIPPRTVNVVATDTEAGSTLQYWGIGGPSAVEVSSNFMHWEVLTNLSPHVGPVTVQDSTATGSALRFYRVRYDPVPPRETLWLRRSSDPSTFHLQYWSDGAPASILSSVDLVHWKVHKHLPPGLGVHDLPVAIDPDRPRQFYRLQLEPTVSRLALKRPSQSSGALIQYWGKGLPATVLVSSNLVDWIPLSTVPVGTGLITVMDANAPRQGSRFYKLRYD